MPLKAPRNLRVTEVDHNSVRLNWDAPSSTVKNYRLKYAKSDDEQTHEVGYEPLHTSEQDFYISACRITFSSGQFIS